MKITRKTLTLFDLLVVEKILLIAIEELPPDTLGISSPVQFHQEVTPGLHVDDAIVHLPRILF